MNKELNVLYGGPDFPNFGKGFNSFGEVLLKKLKDFADKVLLVDVLTGESLKSDQIRSKIIHLANCLQAVGIKENDVIALCSENRLEYPIVLFATTLLGATSTHFNPTFTDSEMNHVVNLSKPTIIFTSNKYLDKIVRISSKNSFIEHIIDFDNKSTIQTVSNYSDFINHCTTSSNDEDFICKPVDIKTNIAVILFTSGTTGLPKGVPKSQYSIQEVALYPFSKLDSKTTSITLSISPLYHTIGVTAQFGFAACGSTVLSIDPFDTVSYLNAIQVYKPCMLFATTPLLLLLAKSPIVNNYDLSSVQLILCGSAPINGSTIKALQDRVKGAQIFQCYGSTEIANISLMQDNEHCSVGSVGCLRRGLWGKIVDPISGLTLSVNMKGELCVKGNLVMKGYIGFDAINSIDQNGWYHTGDLAYYTENQEWYILDRIKDVIKFKTFNVSPSEVTAVLLTHPHVIDAAVVGQPDKVSGELTVGFVVKKPDTDVTEKELIEYVADNLAYADRLHGGVRFIDSLPKVAAGKIVYRELRNLLKD